MPEYAGFVHTAAGAGNNGLTINLYARNDHSGSVVATTSTDSNGYWAISHGTEGRFDIEVVIDSSNKYRIRYDDQYQIELGEFGQLFLRGTDNAFTQEFRSLPTASRVITFPDATATALLGGYANTSTGVMSLTSTANSAAAVYLHANGGTSETVKIYSNQGTSVTEGAESVNILSDAGGVGIRSTADLAKAVNVTVDGGTTGSIAIFNDQGTSVTEGAESISVLSDDGGIGIRSTANLANAVNITVDGGTTSTMTLFNDQGTSVTEGAASVQLLTDVGGIGIKSTADLANAILLTADGGTSETITIHSDQGTSATEGAASIQLLSDVGGINIKSGLNGAGAILLTADGGTSETIKLHADQGTGASSIYLLSDAGGITIDAGGGTITFADNGVSLGTITGSGWSGAAATATVATTVTITDNENADEANPIIFAAGAAGAGNIGLESDGTLTYNPSDGEITATSFVGALTGNVTGNASGTAATVTTASQGNITTLANVVTVGELVNGSIASGFGTINNGANTITTTGLVSAGSLTVTGTTTLNGTLVLGDAAADTLDITASATVSTDFKFADNIDIALGTNADILIRHSDAVSVNAEITDIIIGTSVHPGVAANSLIASNITASGDMMFATNRGGNTEAHMLFDASEGDTFLYARGVQAVKITGGGAVVVTPSITASGGVVGNVTGNVSGTAATVTTAAQSNITSLGTLTTLTVDNVIVNGTTIGHTSDTDLLTLTSANLAVAGDIEVSGSVEVATIDFTDGDLAMTIADGGGVTFAQASTFTGGLTLNGDVNLAVEKLIKIGGTAEAHDFDDEHSGHGITLTMEAGENLTLGQAVYVDSNGKAQHPDVDAASVTGKPAIGIAMTGASSGASVNVMVLGMFRDATYDFTPGAAVIMTGTDGALTTTAGDTAADGDIVQRVGIAITADMLFVMPSIDEIEHA